MMDNVLRGLKWHTCLCFLDDIVVFSREPIFEPATRQNDRLAQ